MVAEDGIRVDSQLEAMQQFVHRKLKPWPEFVGALVVGSIAHGEARPDSDVDCVLVFDPLNEGIVPAEFVWVPETDAFHTIFEVEASEVGGIQIDAKRMSLEDIRTLEWSESFKHEMAHAKFLWDRQGTLANILQQRVAYPDTLRQSRIEEYVNRADYFLAEWRLVGWMERGGIDCAHDQLTAAFETIIHLLHAYNREWMPWRYRWMVSAQGLAWLPADYRSRAMEITSRVEPTLDNVLRRRMEIVSMFTEIQQRLESEGFVSDSDEAFFATHPGLGYAHNFDAWRVAHANLWRGQ